MNCNNIIRVQNNKKLLQKGNYKEDSKQSSRLKFGKSPIPPSNINISS